MANYKTKREIEKEKQINSEIEKLNKLFAKINPGTKKAVHSLIENAAFMSVTLADLQVEINKNGVTEKYKNGENQFGVKKSSSVEVYNQMVKNHMGIMRQLTDLLPEDGYNKDDCNDGFDDFVSERDDT